MIKLIKYLFFLNSLVAFSQSKDACFDAKEVRGCFPFTVEILDCSNANLGSVVYDYADGKSKLESVSSHIYTTPGLYSITQFVPKSGTNINKLVKTNYISVLDKPEPKFTLSACAENKLKLELLDNPYDFYIINWNDGTKTDTLRTEKSITHTYTSQKNSNVLVIGEYTNLNCRNQSSKTIDLQSVLNIPTIENVEINDFQVNLNWQPSSLWNYDIVQHNPVKVLTSISNTNAKQKSTLSPAGVAEKWYLTLETYDKCGKRIVSDTIKCINATVNAVNNENQLTWLTDFKEVITIRRNGKDISTTKLNSYIDKDIQCNTDYVYEFSTLQNKIPVKAIEKSVKAISTNKPSIPLAVISWTPSNEWKLSASNPSSKSYTVNKCLNSSCSKLDEMTESLIVPKDNSYKVSMTDLCGNVSDFTPELYPIQLKLLSENPLLIEYTNYIGFSPVVYSLQFTATDGSVLKSIPLTSTTYTEPNEFTNQLVTIKVIGTFLSSTTYSNEIKVGGKAQWWFAEAFSPNGDGINELFTPQSIFLDKLTITIYDGWNLPIATINAPGDSWDGTIAGSPALAGVYSYIATGVDQQGKKMKKVGQIHLLR